MANSFPPAVDDDDQQDPDENFDFEVENYYHNTDYQEHGYDFQANGIYRIGYSPRDYDDDSKYQQAYEGNSLVYDDNLVYGDNLPDGDILPFGDIPHVHEEDVCGESEYDENDSQDNLHVYEDDDLKVHDTQVHKELYVCEGGDEQVYKSEYGDEPQEDGYESIRKILYNDQHVHPSQSSYPLVSDRDYDEYTISDSEKDQENLDEYDEEEAAQREENDQEKDASDYVISPHVSQDVRNLIEYLINMPAIAQYERPHQHEDLQANEDDSLVSDSDYDEYTVSDPDEEQDNLEAEDDGDDEDEEGQGEDDEGPHFIVILVDVSLSLIHI